MRVLLVADAAGRKEVCSVCVLCVFWCVCGEEKDVKRLMCWWVEVELGDGDGMRGGEISCLRRRLGVFKSREIGVGSWTNRPYLII